MKKTSLPMAMSFALLTFSVISCIPFSPNNSIIKEVNKTDTTSTEKNDKTNPDNTSTSSPAKEPESKALETYKITTLEKWVFDVTNEERVKQGLKPLVHLEPLSKVAGMHSANMLKTKQFDHNDAEGLTPQGRVNQYLPELFGSVAENIFYSYHPNLPNEEKLAREILTGWMNSPGHRANILKPDYNVLGVGVASSEGNTYATQNFSEAFAIAEFKIPDNLKAGETLKLNFKFLNAFEKEKLSIFVEFPDKNHKFNLPTGGYYTGIGEYKPQWKSEDSFFFNLKLEAGAGDYKIKMAKDGMFYDSKFILKVSAN